MSRKFPVFPDHFPQVHFGRSGCEGVMFEYHRLVGETGAFP